MTFPKVTKKQVKKMIKNFGKDFGKNSKEFDEKNEDLNYVPWQRRHIPLD